MLFFIQDISLENSPNKDRQFVFISNKFNHSIQNTQHSILNAQKIPTTAICKHSFYFNHWHISTNALQEHIL